MAYISGYQGQFNANGAATIAASATKSGVVSCGGLTLCGILMPTAFTGTTITFEASNAADGTFSPVYNSAGQVSYTVAAARFVSINPVDFQGVAFLKIVSGSAEGASRALICSLKGF